MEAHRKFTNSNWLNSKQKEPTREEPLYVALLFLVICFIEVEGNLLNKTAHRPWPLPSRPWVVAMRWHDLLFLHWPVG